ncbi:Hypothetical predicted protein [Mytilus galloprovincialis]|uniref:Uncharacterized protein n=1 Tax=Mytilus galloprovincialis TaxID=29158 RepID=A0A8B6CQS6_MYTGA|nr:Hypothetical predicted protein [Mytilus galloprovincialis]
MERNISLLLIVAYFYTVFGNTEFPCRFPCPWRSKTFDLYNISLLDEGTPFLNWTVDASGKSGVFPNGVEFECYQITDRFIIFRYRGTDIFFCSPIFYDGSKNPVTFTLNDGTDFERENKKGKFADICDLCSNPSTLKIVFVESGTPPPKEASVDCNLPRECKRYYTYKNCPACDVCKTEGNVPKACKGRPRHIYQTNNNNKKTWMRRYGKPQRNGKGNWLYGKKRA